MTQSVYSPVIESYARQGYNTSVFSDTSIYDTAHLLGCEERNRLDDGIDLTRSTCLHRPLNSIAACAAVTPRRSDKMLVRRDTCRE